MSAMHVLQVGGGSAPRHQVIVHPVLPVIYCTARRYPGCCRIIVMKGNTDRCSDCRRLAYIYVRQARLIPVYTLNTSGIKQRATETSEPGVHTEETCGMRYSL